MCNMFPPPPTAFSTSANTSLMSLNSSVHVPSTFPSIQLLGLEMLLHYFLGAEVIATAAKNKLILSLGENQRTRFVFEFVILYMLLSWT